MIRCSRCLRGSCPTFTAFDEDSLILAEYDCEINEPSPARLREIVAGVLKILDFYVTERTHRVPVPTD